MSESDDPTRLLRKSNVYILSTPSWHLTIKRIGRDKFELSGNTDILQTTQICEMKIGQELRIPLRGKTVIPEPPIVQRHSHAWLSTVDVAQMTEEEFTERAFRLHDGEWWA